MKVFLITILSVLLTDVGCDKVKPETQKTEQGVRFEIINLGDEIRKIRPDTTEDYYFIQFIGINAGIHLPRERSLEWMREQEALKVEYRITPEMDYDSHTKTWEETEGILVTKVSAGDQVIYDASICEVHGVTMKRELLPVIYGSGGDDWELLISREHPHNGHFALEGCVVPKVRYTRAYRYVCPVCKKLFEQKQAEIIEANDVAPAETDSSKDSR